MYIIHWDCNSKQFFINIIIRSSSIVTVILMESDIANKATFYVVRQKNNTYETHLSHTTEKAAITGAPNFGPCR